jgi:hypothetical protein
MRQLQTRHILLFRILRDHCLFLTRRQIQRVFTLPTNPTNKELQWLVAGKYLNRRYRADTFAHFQTPVYYLGPIGWHMVGAAKEDYKGYRVQIEQRAERHLGHTLGVYDVYLKFLLESDVKRIIQSEDRVWQEAIDFGNIPDGWIQVKGTEAFIEIDRATENKGALIKKFDNYIRFKESGGYYSLFTDCAFRVLFITTTEERIGMLERLTISDDMWFCTMDEFLREPLDHAHWFALRGLYALPTGQKEVSELQ